MSDDVSSAPQSGVFHPPRALSRKSLLPILYLAERMASADNEAVRRETRIIDQLAQAAGMDRFRDDPDFKRLNEELAFKSIGSDLAKKATLVILSLILKADVRRKDDEHEYFSRVREHLGAAPITVPIEKEAHTKLALEYVQD